jgi:hypothetical protein
MATDHGTVLDGERATGDVPASDIYSPPRRLSRMRSGLAFLCGELGAVRDRPGATAADLEEHAVRRIYGILERDRAEEECDEGGAPDLVRRLQETVEHTNYFYGHRMQRLEQFAKERGLWPEFAAILANGTLDVTEPPTYAQQLNDMRHRAEKAEREVRELRDRLAATSPDQAS